MDIASFNEESNSFGFFRAAFQWSIGGSIIASFRCSEVAYTSYPSGAHSNLPVSKRVGVHNTHRVLVCAVELNEPLVTVPTTLMLRTGGIVCGGPHDGLLAGGGPPA